MTMLYVTAGGVLLIFAGAVALVAYAKKSEREKVKRWLAEQSAREAEGVVDVLSEPLPSDAEFLRGVRKRSGLRDDKG